MAANSKIKYAIGLFSEPGKVHEALAELAPHHWPIQHVRVIAAEGALERMLELWRKTSGEHVVCEWVVCRPEGAGSEWLFIPLEPSSALGKDAHLDPLPGFGLWAPKRQAYQLETHLRSGGSLLVIRSQTTREEQAAWGTLLRHATGGVQTHEVSLRHMR